MTAAANPATAPGAMPDNLVAACTNCGYKYEPQDKWCARGCGPRKTMPTTQADKAVVVKREEQGSVVMCDDTTQDAKNIADEAYKNPKGDAQNPGEAAQSPEKDSKKRKKADDQNTGEAAQSPDNKLKEDSKKPKEDSKKPKKDSKKSKEADKEPKGDAQNPGEAAQSPDKKLKEADKKPKGDAQNPGEAAQSPEKDSKKRKKADDQNTGEAAQSPDKNLKEDSKKPKEDSKKPKVDSKKPKEADKKPEEDSKKRKNAQLDVMKAQLKKAEKGLKKATLELQKAQQKKTQKRRPRTNKKTEGDNVQLEKPCDFMIPDEALYEKLTYEWVTDENRGVCRLNKDQTAVHRNLKGEVVVSTWMAYLAYMREFQIQRMDNTPVPDGVTKMSTMTSGHYRWLFHNNRAEFDKFEKHITQHILTAVEKGWKPAAKNADVNASGSNEGKKNSQAEGNAMKADESLAVRPVERPVEGGKGMKGLVRPNPPLVVSPQHSEESSEEESSEDELSSAEEDSE